VRQSIPGTLVARHTAALDSLVGRTLGRRRYEVVARIAQGGMAIVYRGHDRQLDRTVAIKVPRPELARDRAFSEQFRREARAAARLSHPNVVAVYDSGEERGLPWIVMEHVSGQTLRGLLDAQGRLDPETTAELLGPVADALDHAHHAGIAHLDVKPENVLLASEAVKVADFGLVRAAAQRGHGQALAATVHYCAPEVLRGGVVDGRADVYALGVVAWECLVGRPPFGGDQATVVQQHLRGRVPPPSSRLQGVPEPFDAAVLRATDPDPARRFPRASEFAAAIGAPRRRRVDEALRATTVVAAPAHDTAVVDAHPAAYAPSGNGAASAPTRPGTAGGTAWGRGGPAAWPGAGDGGAQPPAGWAPLGPRPTTGRTPRARAARAKRRVRGRWLAALLVVGLLATGLVTRVGGLLGGTVRVPAVVGEQVADATRSLQSRGLRVQVAKPVPSDHVPEGLVATQSIDGGEAVKRDTTVVLAPSLGILVPDLTGRPAGEAESRFEELGIRSRQDHTTSLRIPKGSVVHTRPAAGTVLKDGQPVVIVVSAGKPKVEVPQVAGRSFDDARAVLAAAHLQAKRTVRFDDTMPKGLVARTEPAAGAALTWGSAVTVVVSKGPDLVVVPDVVGLSKQEAEQRLREAGLRWSYFFPIGSQVIQQSPQGGEKARRGSEVRLVLNLL
jgi:beta-lactam-binding protein with PASTA domain/tRNA A-37 threonylcarbamoyl transferase component Bud32